MRNKIIAGVAIAIVVIVGAYQILLHQFITEFGKSFAGSESYNFQVNQISFLHTSRQINDSLLYRLKQICQQQEELRPDTAFSETIKQLSLQNDKIWPKDSLLFIRTKEYPTYLFYLLWNKDQSGIQMQQIYYLNDSARVVQHEKNPNSASEMHKQIQSVEKTLTQIMDTIR